MLGQKFFSVRVVDLWNALAYSIFSVNAIAAFKKKLEEAISCQSSV